MKNLETEYRVNDQGMIVEEIDRSDADKIDKKEYPHYSTEHLISKSTLATH